jgi:hypothetical protein
VFGWVIMVGLPAGEQLAQYEIPAMGAGAGSLSVFMFLRVV